MEQKEKATITIDDKNYIIEDLPDGAKYCIRQIQDLQQQSAVARSKVDQLEMANQGFMAALRVELDKTENPPTEGE